MSDYARHEHHDFVGAVDQALGDKPLQTAGVILLGAALGHFDVAPAGEGFDHHEQVRCATPLILVVPPLRAIRPHRQGRA